MCRVGTESVRAALLFVQRLGTWLLPPSASYRTGWQRRPDSISSTLSLAPARASCGLYVRKRYLRSFMPCRIQASPEERSTWAAGAGGGEVASLLSHISRADVQSRRFMRPQSNHLAHRQHCLGLYCKSSTSSMNSSAASASRRT